VPWCYIMMIMIIMKRASIRRRRDQSSSTSDPNCEHFRTISQKGCGGNGLMGYLFIYLTNQAKDHKVTDMPQLHTNIQLLT